ncbi:hydrolase [Methylacidiphilum kamchatkense Kam1]|uniref:Hydrolase n=1 Tax=Methylacidiphilum kamchatkense Kam1 TaxID=1202785 RepID=A0A0C1RJV6_9BACT|nr:HAD-IA family hydrolase [Methylacidiphilum kamchatkense]KIE58352.1 hydrolase [Methylacidiphilum kamchatkense Kam1]QDQ42243.1 putative hydrolase of the HAD superfamily [Methylacidiphilum kamchatkense Kam1]
MPFSPINTLFLDVGGVLLTNGWDSTGRKKAAEVFGLDPVEFEERHHLTFDTYEQGKLTLHDYLKRTVFYQNRPFSMDDFRQFMFSLSRPYPEMIELIKSLKNKYNLRIAVLSNEGRELQIYRIQTFGLYNFIDYFIVSSFVHLRKPDVDIFQLALDVSQSPPQSVLYIEDRPMFVDIARSLGIEAIRHESFEKTKAALASFGLVS